jgi:L-2-hydroxyglutarate oxidase LhgO
VDEIQARGGEVRCNARVNTIRRSADGWSIEYSSGHCSCDFLITCAGLHSDRLAALTRSEGGRDQVKIVPFRGEYFLIRPERQFLVRNLIYPVPDPRFPFLGVHFTRMIRGGVECGPNAVLAFAREGYRKTDVSLRDIADALSFPGLWRFLRKYPDASWKELRRSFSKELFCHTLQRLVPQCS